MPLNCFGFHDYSDPHIDPDSEYEIWIRECLSCGKRVKVLKPWNYMTTSEQRILLQRQTND